MDKLTVAQLCERTNQSKRYLQRLLKDNDTKRLKEKFNVKSFETVGRTYLLKVYGK